MSIRHLHYGEVWRVTCPEVLKWFESDKAISAAAIDKKVRTMFINRLYIFIGLLLAFALFCGMAAYADEVGCTTTTTIDAPAQAQQHVSPAGMSLGSTGQQL